MFRLTLIIALTGCFAGHITAQQFPLHTQYFFNDLFYNPATAGHYKNIEGFASVRSQWTGLKDRPATYMLGGEYGISGRPWGLGGFLQNDVTGPLSRLGLTLSGSYAIDLSDSSQLYFGLAGGLYRFGVKSNATIKQANDPTYLSAQEAHWMPDANIGVYFTHKNYYAGLSVPQFLQSKADLSQNGVESAYQTTRAIYLAGGAAYPLQDYLTLKPSLLFRYSSPQLFQLEVTGLVDIMDLVQAGLSYRTEDAFAVIVGATIEHTYQLSYSYDITTSALQHVSGGSHEVYLSYRLSAGNDRDNDGIPDEKDECPDEPGPRSNNGCPIEQKEQRDKDKDGDGIMDKEDECPNTFGVKEEKGCPIVKKEDQATLDIAIKNLEFEWDKAIIEDTSLPYLDSLASLLLEKDDWKLYIAGHTDNSGTEEYNYRLSKDRAFAVRDYLMSKGVDKKRFTVEFFGEYMPIATNDTPEGRQKNRRVEMKFIFD